MSYQDQEKEKYRHQPFVVMARVSDDSHKQNSDGAQVKYLMDWADARQMVHVRDYIEGGLSGSLPGNRTDLRQVLDDADQFGDFKFVLYQRVDRATRGGADHLFWFEHELKRRGVRLVCPGDELPENVPFRNTLVAAKADAAQETAASTGQRTAQGSQFALEARRISPHSRTPYGCYRLYCRGDDTPLHVIVDLRNGTQEKRSWPELGLVDTYGTIGGGQTGHYRKQKSELVYIVPGSPAEQEVVRDIFKLRYEDGLSARKIAQYLNGKGIRAPMGGVWAEGQVSNIYENEDYTGRGVANRESAARYCRRHRSGPQRVEHDVKTLTTADHIKPVTRDPDDWFEGHEPYMVDYLKDENLRQTAMAEQKRIWARRADPTYTPKNKKKHTPGPYLLHPLLRCKQKNESLVGSISGKPGSPVRVYRHKEAKRNPQKNSIYGRVFNAEALESAVLNVLRDVLLDWPDLEPRLLAHAEAQAGLTRNKDAVLTEKQERRDEIQAQLLLYVRMLTLKTRAAMGTDIGRLEVERDALDIEIDMINRQRASTTINPAAVVASLKTRLRDLADHVNDLPRVTLMNVLAQLTDRLEADMETKVVHFAFRFPVWMLNSDTKTAISALCTRATSEFSGGHGTHLDSSFFVPLGDGDCKFVKHQRSVTCRCERRAA